MEIEHFDILPFGEWLLGPNWLDGLLFQPAPLAALLAVFAVACLAWVVGLRRNARPLAAWTAWIAIGLSAAILATTVLVTVWLALPVREDAGHLVRSFQAVMSAAAAVLGPPLTRLLGAAWHEGALFQAVVALGNVAFAAIALGWLAATLRSGPRAACRTLFRALSDGALELAGMSPRRLWALAWLTIKESIRRRVMVVFGLFVLILLLAGWFLDPGSTHPARLYLDFVLTSSGYLVLVLALFLSTLSLPADIRNRTLPTVVAKPVRRCEIVLGRMLGFALLGTVLLAVMGAISYVFVDRGLSHRHELLAADVELVVEELGRGSAAGEAGEPGVAAPVGVRTTETHKHRHRVFVDPAALAEARKKGRPLRLRTDAAQDHWHEVVIDPGTGAGPQVALPARFGSPQGMLVARVPLHGKLRFKDRGGNDAERGVNVGDEWTYRSHIQGGTLAAAIWTFEGVTEARFPDGLPVEMTIEVFRTHKGDIEKGVPGSLTVRNPRTGLTSAPRIFESKEFAFDTQFLPRKLASPDGEPLDLFRDLVDGDRVEVWLRCVASQQYLGASQADLYLRARDAPFWLNFVKGYAGLWMQMALVVGFGVMFSTFLSGPIAMLATAGALLMGMFRDFVAELASGELIGGGPIESFRRLITQDNMISELEPGLQTTLTLLADRVLESLFWIAAAVLPAFDSFHHAGYVSYGFDISWSLLAKCAVQAAAFLVPVFVAGYFFLKAREVAE